MATMVAAMLLLLAAAPQADAAAAQAPAPSQEAMALGRELAESGTLANLMPMLIAKDLDELAKERPALTAEQQARLKTTGEAIAARRRDRVMQLMGMSYARQLSLADLRTLVAASRTPAARAKRAADLPATVAAMTGMGNVDLKRETAAQFCAETKLFCDRR